MSSGVPDLSTKAGCFWFPSQRGWPFGIPFWMSLTHLFKSVEPAWSRHVVSNVMGRGGQAVNMLPPAFTHVLSNATIVSEIEQLLMRLLVFGQTGAGNNWANGHYTEGAELIDSGSRLSTEHSMTLIMWPNCRPPPDMTAGAPWHKSILHLIYRKWRGDKQRS